MSPGGAWQRGAGRQYSLAEVLHPAKTRVALLALLRKAVKLRQKLN